jgi:hypothetical protein
MVGCMARFGFSRPDCRILPAICLPNRQHLKSISPNSIVDPVPDAIKVEPPYIGRTGLFNADADAWLHDKKIEGGLQIQTYRSGRRWSIDGPPLNNTFNLTRRAPRDMKFKRHS